VWWCVSGSVVVVRYMVVRYVVVVVCGGMVCGVVYGGSGVWW
jgi:hypothetical protein